MKTWLKRSLIGTGIVALAGLGIASRYQATDIDMVSVEKTRVMSTVLEQGKVKSTETSDIYSEAQGKIIEVRHQPGDRVKAGELLALMDSADLDAQITSLQGELEATQGMSQVAQGTSGSNQARQLTLAAEQAESELASAQADYNRSTTLFKEGAMSKVELDDSRLRLETKQKAAAQAKAALAALNQQTKGTSLQYQGQIASIRAKLAGLQEQKGKTRITAPRDGVVFEKNVQAGDYTSPGQLLFVTGNPNKTEVEAWYSNQDLANVNVGSLVTVTFREAAKDIKVRARVKSIAPISEEKTSSLGIIEDKTRLTIQLLQYPQGLRLTPGRMVDTLLTVAQADNVLAVPTDTLYTDNGKDYVWLIRNSVAQPVQVEKGLEGDTLTEIVKGLQANDQVAANPHQAELKPGLKVK